jgi:hypothetical protein
MSDESYEEKLEMLKELLGNKDDKGSLH